MKYLVITMRTADDAFRTNTVVLTVKTEVSQRLSVVLAKVAARRDGCAKEGFRNDCVAYIAFALIVGNFALFVHFLVRRKQI